MGGVISRLGLTEYCPSVCPITAETGVNGIGIFNASAEETKDIMDGDPAVQAGILFMRSIRAEVFHGDSLP